MDVQLHYKWSSHQPLIKAVMEEFEPELVVELGIGIFSTRFFLKDCVKQYIGIENNKEWLEKMQDEIDFPENAILRHHSVGFDIAVHLCDVVPEKRQEITEYYKTFAKEVDLRPEKGKVLFVDNYTACRTLALRALGRHFDYIIYHDCEPTAIEWYEYHFGDTFENYKNHNLMAPSWTGLFIKEGIEHNLAQTIEPHIATYRTENTELTGMSFK